MQQTRRAFAKLVAPGGGKLEGNLDEAALVLAQAVDPDVVLADELARLDALAESLDASTSADVALGLFGGAAHDPSRHFAGSATDYYNPLNSLLHQVLDRRVGIPISLSVLLIEVARRKEIHLHGVGMPGHFLVGSRDGFIDPFHRGVVLNEQGCRSLLSRMAGAPIDLPPGALDPTPPALILKRMLVNLAAIGVQQQERRLLRAARSLLATYPDADHRDHIQHAYAAAEIGQFGEAAVAGEQALATVPTPVSEKLAAQIDAWRARLN